MGKIEDVIEEAYKIGVDDASKTTVIAGSLIVNSADEIKQAILSDILSLPEFKEEVPGMYPSGVARNEFRKELKEAITKYLGGK